MPIWKLKALPDAESKLRTKGGKPGDLKETGADGGAAGFSYQNYPISYLHQKIERYLSTQQVPIIDETGITYNIDVSVDALLTDRDWVIRELRRSGLDLVLENTLMLVLVIREPNY
jgi:hypothetical protein